VKPYEQYLSGPQNVISGPYNIIYYIQYLLFELGQLAASSSAKTEKRYLLFQFIRSIFDRRSLFKTFRKLIYRSCSIALHKQSTTTGRTHIAAPFPASGSTTLISGPSHAYLCLPPHSSEPGVFLLIRIKLMMPNAIICKMLYNHLPPP
jgi:hypothetical protein